MGTASLARSATGGARSGWSLITSLVLDGIASPHTRRAYAQALEEFLIWFQADPGRAFNKATVQSYRTELQNKGLAPSSINVRLAAIGGMSDRCEEVCGSEWCDLSLVYHAGNTSKFC